ncbi:hypothetical protein HBN50_01185 [Halobacteriovorax sp. GB3]|uniref:hypothetical protein n=1 Tax=Halobacteriovorax sp. GB3 TaxID=2719615 RepID=UPI002361305D|nr:hypothetical protein [Halobacteriovorax sp. GB3]MDD0851681.1 hypothetical protein [Halobacteriovorax sp. GB3]
MLVLISFNLNAASKYPHNDFKSCNELLQVFFNPDKGYQAYEIPQREIDRSTKRLEEIQASFRNHKLLEEAYIDPDGNLHKLGRSYELRLDSDVYDLLYIFGPPVKKKNEFYVNFKIWRKGPRDYVGRKDRVLRRMPIDQFYELAQTSFFKWDIKPSEYIILRSSKAKHGKDVKEPFEVVEVSHKSVKVRSLEGKLLWVSKRDVFFENMGVTLPERELLKDFFGNGGQGDVVFHQFREHLYYQKSGLYIQMTKVPRGGVFAHDTSLILEEYLDEGIKFLLTTNEHGIHGAFVPKGNNLVTSISKNLGKEADNYIVLTPKIDDSFIVHEVKHYEDFIQKKNAEIVEFFKSKFTKESGFDFQNKDLLPIFQVIKEQRAYATQAIYLRSKDSETKVIEGMFENKEVPYMEWADSFIQTQKDIYESRYLRPYQSFVTSLRDGGASKLAAEVDLFVRSRFIESEDFK